MSEAYETHEHAGLVIEIHQDDSASFSPLKDYDHAGTLYTWRDQTSRGELQDADNSITEPEWMVGCEPCGGYGYGDDDDDDQWCEHCHGEGEVICEPEVFWRRLYSAELAIPLDYDDRGPYSTFDTSDWDDANCAWVFTAKDLEEWGYKSFGDIGGIDWMRAENWIQGRLAQQVVKNSEAITKVTEYTHAHVKEIEDWMRGNVWGFIIREPEPDEDDDDQDDPEELDACWGFICDPDDNHILGEAKAAAEAMARHRKKNPAEVGR